MRSPSRLLVVYGLLAIAALPLAAESDSRFKLFGGVVWATPQDESTAQLAGEIRVVELEDDVGWEAGLEFLATPRIGLEASFAQTSHEVLFGASQLGEAELDAVYLSLNFHLANTEHFDWWVAPTLALYEWSNASLTRGVGVDETRDDGFGATLGFDFELAEHWSLTAALRYIDVQLRFAGGGAVAVDPVSVRAGIGFHF